MLTPFTTAQAAQQNTRRSRLINGGGGGPHTQFNGTHIITVEEAQRTFRIGESIQGSGWLLLGSSNQPTEFGFKDYFFIEDSEGMVVSAQLTEETKRNNEIERLAGGAARCLVEVIAGARGWVGVDVCMSKALADTWRLAIASDMDAAELQTGGNFYAMARSAVAAHPDLADQTAAEIRAALVWEIARWCAMRTKNNSRWSDAQFYFRDVSEAETEQWLDAAAADFDQHGFDQYADRNTARIVPHVR